MTVLMVLASHAGEVVSREQLETSAWPGVVVGYDALASSIIKLRKALGDNSRKPRYIETVSKKGYRLIASVNHEAGIAPAGSHSQSRQFHKPYLLAGVIIASLLLAAGIALTWKTGTSTQSAGKIATSKTLLVLPFINIGNDERHEYFVDGITDDLITDLSGLPGVVVLSSAASYRFKGRDRDPIAAGKEMGADFILEGSIRKDAERWRINAKLVNTYNGFSLWGRRFENKDSSLFDAQDEVVQGIVEALSLQISNKDKLRISQQPTTNFSAYELFLQGQKLFKERNREANESAQAVYRRAIELDSNFTRAYGALAVSLSVHYWRGWSDAPNETLGRALAMAKRATELDPLSPQAHWSLGYAYMYNKQHVKAAAAVEKAISISPNYSDGYGLLALINNQLGNGREAERLILKGMQLNPHYSWDFPYNLGRAYYTMEKYNDALDPLHQALNRNEYAVNPRIYLAATYAALGRDEDASWEIEQIRVFSPETTISHLRTNYPVTDNAVQQRFFGHLRRAGLPE